MVHWVISKPDGSCNQPTKDFEELRISLGPELSEQRVCRECVVQARGVFHKPGAFARAFATTAAALKQREETAEQYTPCLCAVQAHD